MIDVPLVRYATTADGLSIAFQEWGEGEQPLVWVPGTASHLEIFWEIPAMVHLFNRLGAQFRVVMFDKRGTGLSDRSLGTGSLESRMDDIRAVMDAAGIGHAAVVGASESGSLAMMFAAMHPERVDRLVLYAAFPRGTPGAASRIADETEATWGTGRALQAIWLKGAPESSLPELGRYERAMGTPRAIADLMRHTQDLDARSLAPTIRVPTRVIHARDDPIVSFTNAEWLAANIPDAELVAIDGDFHGSANTDELDLLLDPVIEFAAGESVPAEVSAERVLAAVLFNDIIDSTGQANELGDQRWSQRLDTLEHTAQTVVRRHRGRWVKSTGDGVLATFDGPAAAVRAGLEIRDQATNLGLVMRTGVHFGEIERRGDDVGGLGVHIAARVMASADDDEVWVSPTVPGLTIGSLLKFEPRGQHELKGIDGRWDLYAASS